MGQAFYLVTDVYAERYHNDSTACNESGKCFQRTDAGLGPENKIRVVADGRNVEGVPCDGSIGTKVYSQSFGWNSTGGVNYVFGPTVYTELTCTAASSGLRLSGGRLAPL
jgi:hypothetical protein